MTTTEAPATVRVDVWLWAVRVFRTRSAATAACRAGHVKIDGTSVKAAQPVRPGQRVSVRRPGHEQVLEVVRLLTKRVGAPVAAQAYVDHSPPRTPALHAAVPRRERGAGRPTKKDRRETDRLRGL
ncbi:RNA-binding S4 domain-containing protein [Kocuria sp. LUK]|uniref:RNA-binding S4 domain-containing protein n=1 Tax=Kocuria sp. LUK TaxID=2897828 RepID=UPI001E2DAE49|nr:RNA-binding S4 domain-containing protein [Kocuria sp. LUK]MCD1145208.1 RNA-binding S4 domain-containing protein [Kocuria sp. LUK]